MKNAAVIKALPNVKLLRGELKSLDAQIEMLERQKAGLQKQREQLDDEVRLLGRVTEIFEGVALVGVAAQTRYGFDFRVVAAGEDYGRSAEVYTNAHTSKNGVAQDWCIRLRMAGRDQDGRQEHFLGDGWGYKDACLVARRWVAHNETPSDTFEAMAKLRHKLDPKRTAPKRRQEAFEAAYMAGHLNLAEKILRERTKGAARGTVSTNVL